MLVCRVDIGSFLSSFSLSQSVNLSACFALIVLYCSAGRGLVLGTTVERKVAGREVDPCNPIPLSFLCLSLAVFSSVCCPLMSRKKRRGKEGLPSFMEKRDARRGWGERDEAGR